MKRCDMNRIAFLIVTISTCTLLSYAQDTTQVQQRERKHERVQFVDKDGDGIADERTEGLGFKKKVSRIRKQYGKSSQSTNSGSEGALTPQGKSTQQRRGRQ